MRRRRSIGAVFSPLSFFKNGETGAILTPDNVQYLFQTNIGTTQVSASGQSVGLHLDASQSLALGSNVVSNGTFDTDTGWTKGTSWTISSGTANSGGTGSSLTQSVTVSANTLYKITYTVTSISLGNIKVQFQGGTAVVGTVRAASGTYTEYLNSGNNTTLAFVSGGTTPNAKIDDVMVQAVSGNHVSQATSGSRATYTVSGDQTYLVFDGTADNLASLSGGGGTTGFFLCMAVRPTGGAGTDRTLWSDTGTNTGYRVRINSSNQLEFSAGNGTTYTTIATTETISVNTTYVITVWHDGINLNARINNGATESTAFSAATAGTNAFTLCKDNGAATSYFSGNIYANLYVKNTVISDSNRQKAINYAAKKGGITL